MAEAWAQSRAQDLLRLTQWLSPAFPVGGFAYSHGLESFIAQGDVSDVGSLSVWLTAILRSGAGRNDAILLSLTHRGALPDAELAGLAEALCASRERWEETLAQGTAFARATNAILATQLSPMALPVVVGVQSRHLDLPTETVLSLYLQAFASNLISIATRAVPLGQTEAQRLLDHLAPVITELAASCAEAVPEDFASTVLRADLMAMTHETADVRLFRS